MDQRLFVANLYTTPAFKSKWWKDSEIYNEQTPLTADNMTDLLKSYTSYSHVYDNIRDYLEHCPHKSIAPQIVGLDPIDHWVCVCKKSNEFFFFDSSGAPKKKYIEDVDHLPRKFRVKTEGIIRQSPRSNACGLYAAFFCLGYELYNNGYYFWDSCANNCIQYSPFTIDQWEKASKLSSSDNWLHLNDINLYNMYKNMIQNKSIS